MEYSLSGMYVWKSVCDRGYTCLESYLSTRDMVDEVILCVDPTSDDATLNLAKAIEQNDSKARLVWFLWPKNAPGDGSVIGIASNFALAQVRTTHAVNVQADEVWSPRLMEWTRDNWHNIVRSGYDCMQFKVLSLEHNAQRFQGGQTWDGDKVSEDWLWQKGSGYNSAVKLARKCPAIKFARDAWSFEECGLTALSKVSLEYPIVHLHDMFRDHLLNLRYTAATEIWTDREKYGHYLQSAENLNNTFDEWYSDMMWTEKVSPFDELLPDVVKPIIGWTKYHPRMELI
jgi:hypothetical protein